MKFILLLLFSIARLLSDAQVPDSLNTAKNCRYMTAAEKEMIYEINCVRSNPRSCLQYLEPLLVVEKKKLLRDGKGDRNYSLTTSYSTRNGKETKTIDTTWHFRNEEEVKALSSLIKTLKTMKRLSILQPDSGIYLAASKHAADQHAHNWELSHLGSDGSWPWDRIGKYAPNMRFGNENIGATGGFANAIPRDIVLLLLIDSGIPGYGHRDNMLDPAWTHIACKEENFKGMWWWIENFGQKK